MQGNKSIVVLAIAIYQR